MHMVAVQNFGLLEFVREMHMKYHQSNIHSIQRYNGLDFENFHQLMNWFRMLSKSDQNRESSGNAWDVQLNKVSFSIMQCQKVITIKNFKKVLKHVGDKTATKLMDYWKQRASSDTNNRYKCAYQY